MEAHVSSPANVNLGPLGQIAMPTADLDRAIAFYRDALGMPFLFRVPNLAFFDCGGVRLMLSPPEESGDGRPGSVLYFKVDDVQAAYPVLRDRGVGFIDEPHIIAQMDTYDLWMAFFQDSEGNTLAIMSESPRVS
jgi:catechol 2,3-dioxygenase-like lactoylglutathione lyase family enzyme